MLLNLKLIYKVVVLAKQTIFKILSYFFLKTEFKWGIDLWIEGNKIGNITFSEPPQRLQSSNVWTMTLMPYEKTKMTIFSQKYQVYKVFY